MLFGVRVEECVFGSVCVRYLTCAYRSVRVAVSVFGVRVFFPECV